MALDAWPPRPRFSPPLRRADTPHRLTGRSSYRQRLRAREDGASQRGLVLTGREVGAGVGRPPRTFSIVAWRWVPFFRAEKGRATGLPTGVAEARRFRLLLDAYGLEPDIGIVAAGIARKREFLGHMQKLAADGSEHEVELAPPACGRWP